MDFLNLKVRHKVFGNGVITEVDEKYITIKFKSKETKFIYPDSFEKFLVAEDESIQSVIMEEIERTKQTFAKECLVEVG